MRSEVFERMVLKGLVLIMKLIINKDAHKQLVNNFSEDVNAELEQRKIEDERIKIRDEAYRKARLERAIAEEK